VGIAATDFADEIQRALGLAPTVDDQNERIQLFQQAIGLAGLLHKYKIGLFKPIPVADLTEEFFLFAN